MEAPLALIQASNVWVACPPQPLAGPKQFWVACPPQPLAENPVDAGTVGMEAPLADSGEQCLGGMPTAAACGAEAVLGGMPTAAACGELS